MINDSLMAFGLGGAGLGSHWSRVDELLSSTYLVIVVFHAPSPGESVPLKFEIDPHVDEPTTVGQLTVAYTRSSGVVIDIRLSI